MGENLARTAGELRSGNCACDDPYRPLSHREDCPAWRPLSSWSNTDLDATLAEADQMISDVEATTSRLQSAAMESWRRHLDLLNQVRDSDRHVGNLRALRRGILRERKLRDEHPFVVVDSAES